MSSPSPSTGTPTSSVSNSSELELAASCESMSRCGACGGPLVLPKVLTCFHSFCRPCLERLEDSRRIVCPVCRLETYLPADGITGLLPYFGPASMLNLYCFASAACWHTRLGLIENFCTKSLVIKIIFTGSAHFTVVPGTSTLVQS